MIDASFGKKTIDGKYKSKFKKLNPIFLPNFSGTRVLMMPFRLEDINTLPNDLLHYKQTVEELVAVSPTTSGVAYLTIDEKLVKKGNSLRLKGLHVDGLGSDDRPDLCIWAACGLNSIFAYEYNETTKQWSHRNIGSTKWYHGAAGIGGMITVSNPVGCRAWNKEFEGSVRKNGDCEHLRETLFPDEEATIFEAGVAYWCNSTCVHESMPMEEDTERTFVRLSMPSEAPWYQGYTRNPKGVEPVGKVILKGGWSYGRVNEPEIILKS
jgi:hypothetical protein